jgi:tRNA(Ile)-lysidine synthase
MYHWAVHKLAQTVLGYSRKQRLLEAGDRVGIAVSGGADSVALLRLTLELREEIGLVISVLHLNHQLRGAESDGDEVFVRELAGVHDLEFICEHLNVKAHAAEKNVGLEAAGRKLRYEFFRKILETGACSKIATAHTLDDQAETVLLKLARGAGTRGMAGIWPQVAVSHQSSAISRSKNASIVRPFLATRRTQLRHYLADIGQSWREDSSNRDLRHTRNRIRHGILPRLERHVNPNMRETLAETAEISRAEEEYWAHETERLLLQVWKINAQGGALDRKLLETFPLALRRRLLRAAAESLELDLPFEHVEQILGLKENGSSLLLIRGWSAQLRGDEIRFRKRAPADLNYRYELCVPGKITVPEAGLEIEAVPASGNEAPEACDAKAVLDCRFAGKNLAVRSWRPGERFWPSHFKEPRKIKELLQDRHITGDEKQRWPVIVLGDEVVWMSGFGVRRDFQTKNGAGVRIREWPLPTTDG